MYLSHQAVNSKKLTYSAKILCSSTTENVPGLRCLNASCIPGIVSSIQKFANLQKMTVLTKTVLAGREKPTVEYSAKTLFSYPLLPKQNFCKSCTFGSAQQSSVSTAFRLGDSRHSLLLFSCTYGARKARRSAQI